MGSYLGHYSYSNIVTLPAWFVCVLQGVLVYWVTNSLYTTCEILFFKIPQVKHLFGIPNFETPPEDNS